MFAGANQPGFSLWKIIQWEIKSKHHRQAHQPSVWNKSVSYMWGKKKDDNSLSWWLLFLYSPKNHDTGLHMILLQLVITPSPSCFFLLLLVPWLCTVLWEFGAAVQGHASTWSMSTILPRRPWRGAYWPVTWSDLESFLVYRENKETNWIINCLGLNRFS